ncbi:helix-turn-helix transcriptional regulator [Paenibacillus roseipurpureus]|uniref:AraC family transcriptional regulator n=1 Tax=Paenibacillus roseopurpureus TaxID=2918901 RepID=A0AA96LKS5_9BACL|nr:AraC family transcriptional regulator [Paenibacillus sp. MBLB1832]WNR42901.1 AraC family transcriptional regulator [Paenibacillus sp. MBLB1832]
MRVGHFLAPPRYGEYVCYPESFGHIYDDPTHGERRDAQVFPMFNLHLLFKGAGTIHYRGRWVELQEGTGFLYAPGTAQMYSTDKMKQWSVRWVHFYSTSFTSVLESRCRVDGVWLFSWKGAPRLITLFDELLTYGDTIKQEEEAHFSALFYEILVELIQNGENLIGSPAAGLRTRILNAADWIRAHCHESITLDQMAEVAGYSPYYFSRQFHEVVGKTPMGFLLESRIVRSKQLLSTTELSVRLISERVGFSQSSYFIRKFREQQGMTPEHFRQYRG